MSPARPWDPDADYGDDGCGPREDVDALLSRLAVLQARSRGERAGRFSTDHLRASPVVCEHCVREEHRDCVRPCTCAGKRHGRVVAHTAGSA